MKLYSIAHSPYAARVRAQVYLRELDVDIEAPPGGLGSDEYKQISPTGKVPALDTGNGVIVESIAIIAFLEQVFPEGGLMPTEPMAQAQLRALLLACDSYLSPALFPLFKRLQAGMDKDGVESDLQALRTALQTLEGFWQRANIGDQTGLADCVIAPVFFYIDALAPMFGAAAVFDETPVLAARWHHMQQSAPIAKVLDEMRAGLKAMMGG